MVRVAGDDDVSGLRFKQEFVLRCLWSVHSCTRIAQRVMHLHELVRNLVNVMLCSSSAAGAEVTWLL